MGHSPADGCGCCRLLGELGGCGVDRLDDGVAAEGGAADGIGLEVCGLAQGLAVPGFEQRFDVNEEFGAFLILCRYDVADFSRLVHGNEQWGGAHVAADVFAVGVGAVDGHSVFECPCGGIGRLERLAFVAEHLHIGRREFWGRRTCRALCHEGCRQEQEH